MDQSSSFGEVYSLPFRYSCSDQDFHPNDSKFTLVGMGIVMEQSPLPQIRGSPEELQRFKAIRWRLLVCGSRRYTLDFQLMRCNAEDIILGPRLRRQGY